MSMSLRDQLLAAGLINKKQANEAERQRQHQERQERQQPAKRAQASAAQRTPPPAQAAKAAHDQALNRQKQEKAQRKARSAEIKQLIERNRLAPTEGDEFFNFIDGTKIRRIAAHAALREQLGRGEIVIVRHRGRYDLVPAATAARVRERDETAVIALPGGSAGAAADESQGPHAIPDDLMW